MTTSTETQPQPPSPRLPNAAIPNEERAARIVCVSDSYTYEEALSKLQAKGLGHELSARALAKWCQRLGISLRPLVGTTTILARRASLAEGTIMVLVDLVAEATKAPSPTALAILVGQMKQTLVQHIEEVEGLAK